jgi:hypothetical protein
MHMGNRVGIRAAVAMAWLASGIGLSQAAGALAVGRCAAYGYGIDFPTVRQASEAALRKCEGSCKQVVTTKNGCVAFAVDGRKPCGPHGFASASRLGKAQNSALKHCYRLGGKDCMIRAWICDGKG